MSRKKEFDPHAIPNYGGAGRVGEIDPNEPEEQMSSAQIAGSDPEVQTDPAAGVAAADAEESEEGGEGQERPTLSPAGRPRTLRDDRVRGETHNPSDNPEPLTSGPGGLDGLVGAP